ncbi:uracil-DNA glycosylase [Acidocella sp.]|uniref:uracil-DNA glycosylase n=1 Tax=Acidocella sp. TaxID=50710 RepID=UPI00260B1B99|nr:uracil-DNA glycosylase [Acidocella sp.]
MSFTNPGPDCPLCPRLAAYRAANRRANPTGFNAPVPGFGPLSARLLVVGQAPGVNGANTTGRPFTGDVAGRLLYAGLAQFGFATGTYAEHANDGLTLHDCRVTNAVRCAPPQHKLETAEEKACRPFLERELAAMPNLRVCLAIGEKPHKALLQALGLKLSTYKFAHGAIHALPHGLKLADSFHTSQYNVNTGRITPAMFEAVLAGVATQLDLR